METKRFEVNTLDEAIVKFKEEVLFFGLAG